MATPMLLNEWVEANVRKVAEHFPQFSVVEPPSGSGAVLAVRGKLAPFKSDEQLGQILDDLEQARPILIHGGRVLHDPECRATHSHGIHVDQLDRNLEFEFLVLGYPPKRHPKAFCVAPEISKITFPEHPHLNPDSSACPYLPSDKVMRWDERTISTLLDYTAIWAAKHQVWVATGGPGQGRWIGEEAPHNPYDVLRTVADTDPCPCGNSKKFRNCCKGRMEKYVEDVEALLAKLKGPDLPLGICVPEWDGKFSKSWFEPGPRGSRYAL